MDFGKDSENLSQGDINTGTLDKNNIFIMETDRIGNIPDNRTITYAGIVVDYHYQKEYPIPIL